MDAVVWFQKLAGVETMVQSQNSVIKAVRDGWRRKAAKPTMKKEQIMSKILQEMVRSLSEPMNLT